MKKQTEPFIMLPRSLLQSDAWRSQSINCRRLVDFLMLEHLGKGGTGNGALKAPRHQLVAFGIGARYISAAIKEAEHLGLVAAHRGGMRVATMYTLTWLPHRDGTAATNGWHGYANPELAPLSRKIQKSE